MHLYRRSPGCKRSPQSKCRSPQSRRLGISLRSRRRRSSRPTTRASHRRSRKLVSRSISLPQNPMYDTHPMHIFRHHINQTFKPFNKFYLKISTKGPQSHLIGRGGLDAAGLPTSRRRGRTCSEMHSSQPPNPRRWENLRPHRVGQGPPVKTHSKYPGWGWPDFK